MTKNNQIEVSVPGRICLFGDKVDLLGKPVIAAAINATMKVIVKKRSDSIVKFYSKDLDVQKEYDLQNDLTFDHPLKYWSAIVNRLKPKISGFEAIVESEIPIGVGLSSSAAISVALIKALNEAYELNLKKDEIAELAYVCEHDDLGISCGRMDQYSITYGGITFIETGEVPKVTPLDVDSLPVVVGNTQEPRHAETVLNRIREQINNEDPVVLGAFEKVAEIVENGRKALLKGNFIRVGELMTLQQEQENILKAATDKLNLFCKKAIEAGAYGAKQMGAGGGGCMIAVCPGKQQAVKKVIAEAGGKPWIFKVFQYNEKDSESNE